MNCNLSRENWPWHAPVVYNAVGGILGEQAGNPESNGSTGDY